MKVNNQNQNFSTQVKKHFDFLIDEYGFKTNPKRLGYIKDSLELEFYHGKGEVGITFFVRRDDEIFKPFISRSFDLLHIATRQAVN